MEKTAVEAASETGAVEDEDAQTKVTSESEEVIECHLKQK